MQAGASVPRVWVRPTGPLRRPWQARSAAAALGRRRQVGDSQITRRAAAKEAVARMRRGAQRRRAVSGPMGVSCTRSRAPVASRAPTPLPLAHRRRNCNAWGTVLLASADPPSRSLLAHEVFTLQGTPLAARCHLDHGWVCPSPVLGVGRWASSSSIATGRALRAVSQYLSQPLSLLCVCIP